MQKQLRVGIVDLVVKQPEHSLASHVMNANFAGIMPQVVGVWCRRAGHDVAYVCYTGREDLLAELPRDVDLVFISAFTEAAELAYALPRMRRAGFRALLPGIESWFDLGNKSKVGGRQGLAKVGAVSEQVQGILRQIPYVQTNFVLGLDSDAGDEPFELTKEFVDRTPGAFPGYSMLTAFGDAAELNRQYERDGRVLPFPFFFLNNNQAMNVRPLNYSWTAFYDRVIDLVRYSFSWRRILRRMRATSGVAPRALNVIRAVSSEGRGRLRYHVEIRRRLAEDPEFRPFFEQETTRVPSFYVDSVRRGLGPFWEWLPQGALRRRPSSGPSHPGGRRVAAAAPAHAGLEKARA